LPEAIAPFSQKSSALAPGCTEKRPGGARKRTVAVGGRGERALASQLQPAGSAARHLPLFPSSPRWGCAFEAALLTTSFECNKGRSHLVSGSIKAFGGLGTPFVRDEEATGWHPTSPTADITSAAGAGSAEGWILSGSDRLLLAGGLNDAEFDPSFFGRGQNGGTCCSASARPINHFRAAIHLVFHTGPPGSEKSFANSQYFAIQTHY